MPHSRARLGHGPPAIPRHLGLLALPCSSSLGHIACVPPTRSGGTDDRDTRRSGRSRPGGPLHRPDEAAPRRASLPHPSATNLLWIYPTLPTPYPLRGHVRHIHRRLVTIDGQRAVQAEENFREMQKTLSGLRAFREQLVFDLLGQ